MIVQKENILWKMVLIPPIEFQTLVEFMQRDIEALVAHYKTLYYYTKKLYVGFSFNFILKLF